MKAAKRIKCCDVSFKCLRICKILPEDGEEDSLKYIVPVFGIATIIFCLYFLMYIYIFVALKYQYTIEHIQFGIVCAVSISGVLWINSFCIRNRHLLITLAEAMSDFKTFGKPDGYDNFKKKMNFLAKIHLLYVTSGCILYFVVFAPMHQSDCEKLNTEKNFTEICSLLLPIYIPFVEYSKLGKPSALFVIDTIQFLSLCGMYTTCGTVVWVNLEMVEYIRHRMKHLKALILIALKNTDSVARRNRFRFALRYHEEILRMGRLADKFFGTELFLHVVLTGAILGISAFVMISTQTLQVLMVFVGWLNAIIMGCVAGQRLTNESLTIPDILYEVDWYNFDSDLKKDLVFFLLRCKKPMYIKAGNVIMTNQLIIEILRTAYSYVTFLSSIGN